VTAVKNEWKPHRLDELGFVGRGKSRHRPRNDARLYGGEYPFIQTADVMNADPYITDYSQTYTEFGLQQSKLWPPNTLCMTIAGANTAKTAILKFGACFPDSIVGFIPDNKRADLHFVKYSLDLMKQRFLAVSRGATQDNLSLDKLLSFPLLTPPLPIQRQIAGILSGYDDLIENNQRRIKILEEMARSLYREWFVNFRFPGHEKVPLIDSPLGSIPKGWEVKTVEEIVKRIPVGKKYDQKTVSSTGAVPVFDQGKTGIIGYHDDEPGVEASESTPVIVFANHTCYQRLVHFSFSAIQNVLPFVPYPALSRNIYWLHWATNGLVAFNDYKGHWPEFAAKTLIVPPAYLCEAFGGFAGPLSRGIFKLERIIENLRRTRNLLLPRLLSGETLWE
jgi:type I restriction enzyme S subunit